MFERRKCNHKEAIPGDDCLASVIGANSFLFSCYRTIPHESVLARMNCSGDTNKHRYVVSTQSQPLRVKLRSIPGVPILHVNRSVMILEPPSDTTLRAKHLVSLVHSGIYFTGLMIIFLQAEQQSLAPSTSEIGKLKAAAPESQPVKKKRRVLKARTPLASKRKKSLNRQRPRLRAKSQEKTSYQEK